MYKSTKDLLKFDIGNGNMERNICYYLGYIFWILKTDPVCTLNMYVSNVFSLVHFSFNTTSVALNISRYIIDSVPLQRLLS